MTNNKVVVTKKKCSKNKDRWLISVNNVQVGHAEAKYKTATQRKWNLHISEIPLACGSTFSAEYLGQHTINKGVLLLEKDLAQKDVKVNQSPATLP